MVTITIWVTIAIPRLTNFIPTIRFIIMHNINLSAIVA